MTTEEALQALEPFTDKIPTAALDTIRATWPEAEPVLLEELDWRIEHPYAYDKSGRFLYALFLCGEMKSAAAFDRYLAMARLPEMMLDQVLGDMLTESLNHLLANTCHGRFDELKALMEDRQAYEFARTTALEALYELILAGKFPRTELERYCLELLSGKLEKRRSYCWDSTIAMAAQLSLADALPLVKQAYDEGLMDPWGDDYETVAEALASEERSKELFPHTVKSLGTTEAEMRFYADYWGQTGGPREPDHSGLLNAPANARQQKKRKNRGKEPGRNEPCPCGSGKKYKKCCIETGFVRDGDLQADSVEEPLNRTDEWIMAGYYYEKNHGYGNALSCWIQAWPDVLRTLPESVRDPDSDVCDNLFNGYDFLSNWLQDVEQLVDGESVDSYQALRFGMDYYPSVLERFPNMNPQIVRNFEASLARLECICGKKEAAFARLQRLIEIWPDDAQGYVVLSELLSLDAEEYNIEPDIPAAQQLLLQAKMKAKNASDWDLDLRIEDLTHLAPG